MFDTTEYLKAELDYRSDRVKRGFARGRQARARTPLVRRPGNIPVHAASERW